MAHERKCIVDNTNYEYCGKCKSFNSEETWRYLFCSENCKGIYGIYDEYRQGRMSANDASEAFKNYEMPSIDNFHEIIKPVIIDIFANTKKEEKIEEEAPRFKKRNKRVEEVHEEPIVNEIVEPTVIEEETI